MSTEKELQSDITPLRKIFNKSYGNLSEEDIQKEILFSQKIMNQKLEKIRKNTSLLVWFLIVIPIITGVLIAVFLT